MDARAIKQANESLQAIKVALDQLKSARDFAEFNLAWSAFLASSNRIYEKLSAGSRLNAKSRQWVGGKKHERKKDPLLQYLHQARNSDYHGLEAVTELVPGQFRFGARPGGGPVRLSTLVMLKSGEVLVDADKPEDLQLTLTPSSAKLVRVFDDRSNRWYETPETDPIKAAEEALAYLEGLLSELEALPWLS